MSKTCSSNILEKLFPVMVATHPGVFIIRNQMDYAGQRVADVLPIRRHECKFVTIQIIDKVWSALLSTLG